MGRFSRPAYVGAILCAILVADLEVAAACERGFVRRRAWSIVENR